MWFTVFGIADSLVILTEFYIRLKMFDPREAQEWFTVFGITVALVRLKSCSAQGVSVLGVVEAQGFHGATDGLHDATDRCLRVFVSL